MSRYEDLAARFGTPTYVYDLDRVAAARQSLFAALPAGVELFYALKANPHPDVARALREGPGPSCRAEISSLGELTAALTAGFAAGECLYTGPGKTDHELAVAIARGVRLFSVESLTDARRVGAVADRHGAVAEGLLRINSPSASAPTGIRMMGRPSQFGIDMETLAALMPELTAIRGLRVVGAHFFTMSNAADESSLVAEFEHTVELAAQLADEVGLPLDYLDIGGGFAAPYAVPGERARYEKLPSELERMLDLHLPQWRSGTPRLACESGRYLVGDSGSLLCGVVNIKESRGHKFVVLDAGINAIGGLSGLGRLLPVAVQLDGADGADVASLVGPLCTPGDLLGRDVPLPALEVGDVVTVPNAGAYGISASLVSFLGRPAPTEVAVRGGQVVSVSRMAYHRTYEPTDGEPAHAVAGLDIDRPVAHTGDTGDRTVLVSSMGSDAHTWNLVYLQLLIEELGYPVVNLGPCVPDDVLVSECRDRLPAMVVLSSVNGHGYQDGMRVIERLRTCPELVGTPIVIGGKLGISQADRGEHVDALLAAGFDAVHDDRADAPALFRRFLADRIGAGRS